VCSWTIQSLNHDIEFRKRYDSFLPFFSYILSPFVGTFLEVSRYVHGLRNPNVSEDMLLDKGNMNLNCVFIYLLTYSMEQSPS